MELTILVLIILGFILDAILGDFWGRFHPICLVGKLISYIEVLVNNTVEISIKVLKFNKMSDSRSVQVIKYLELLLGAVLAVIVIGIVTYISYILTSFNVVFELLIINSAIAYKGLIDHLNKVLRPLKAGNIIEARQALVMIVGRDTEQLSQSEISRAGIETGAESISDGIIAPLFYGVIGGAPLMMAYKAVNTLDSMVGYPFPPYQNIGFFSAKLDDLLNIIPARLTAVFLLAAGWLLKLNLNRGINCLIEDAKKHPSPNAGRPEAAMAGLLNVKLGGENSYQGKISVRPYLNQKGSLPEPKDMSKTINMIRMTSWIGVIVLLIFGFGLRWLLW